LINSRRVQRAWFGLTWAKGACYEFWTKAGMDLARGFAWAASAAIPNLQPVANRLVLEVNRRSSTHPM
jgi:hypothetical protein